MNLKSILLSALLTSSVTLFATDNAPKYIFYFIGDGMGPGSVMGTDTYLRLAAGRSNPLLWERFPQCSMSTTYSYNSPVTDSAAAGTALSSGHKTRNNMLGMGPDSVAVRNIADDLKEMGYGIGLVTNVAADDATPAAFYAHVPSRDMAY
ncbi:MAG: alkaline phosphatase, partial [Muribaculaceae bacterium]|nr:alkaline phosphatase [Muribaculaceae bacterium]